MTLQSQHVTIVIAARIGQAPIYPQIGQGLLGGTIELVLPGDSVSQHKQMDELRLVFEREFDRGALSIDALKLELWQAHWYRASRQAMQRAADMLILAAANEIKIPGSSKLARECEGLAKVLDLFVNAKPTDHPIGDALLRGDPIPAGDGVHRLDLEQSAMPGQPVPLGVEEDRWHPYAGRLQVGGGLTQADLDRIESSALRVDGIKPSALLTADESQALADQIRSTAAAVEAVGNAASKDESPFAVYEFPHEMYAALRRVSEILGGIREVEKQSLEPTPDMLKAGVKVLADVDELMGRIDGESGVYRPAVLTDQKMVEEAMQYRDKQERLASEDKRLSLLEDTVVKTGHVTLDRLERLERGLMALAKAIGPMATDQMLAAMERPA